MPLTHLLAPLKSALAAGTGPAASEFRRTLMDMSWATTSEAFGLTTPAKFSLGKILKSVAHLAPEQQEMAIRILITGARVRPPILANPTIGTLRDKLFHATSDRRDLRDWREKPLKLEYLEGFHAAARLAHESTKAAEIFSAFAVDTAHHHALLAHISAQQRDWFHAYRYSLSALSRAPNSGRLQTNRLLPAADNFQTLVDQAFRA